MKIKTMKKALLLSSSLLTATTAMENPGMRVGLADVQDQNIHKIENLFAVADQAQHNQMVLQDISPSRGIVEDDDSQEDNSQINQSYRGDLLAGSDKILFGNVAYGMVEGIVTEMTTIIETIFANAIRTYGPKAAGWIGDKLGGFVGDQLGKKAINGVVESIIDSLTGGLDTPQRLFQLSNELIKITKIMYPHFIGNFYNNQSFDISKICFQYGWEQTKSSLSSLFSSDEKTFKGHVKEMAQQTKVATTFKWCCQKVGGYAANHAFFGVGTYLIEKNAIPLLQAAFKEVRYQILNHESLNGLRDFTLTHQLEFNELVLEEEVLKKENSERMAQLLKQNELLLIEDSGPLAIEQFEEDKKVVLANSPEMTSGWGSYAWGMGATVVNSSVQAVKTVSSTGGQLIRSVTSSGWLIYKKNSNLSTHRRIALEGSRFGTRLSVIKGLSYMMDSEKAIKLITPIAPNPISYLIGGVLVEVPLAFYTNARSVTVLTFSIGVPAMYAYNDYTLLG